MTSIEQISFAEDTFQSHRTPNYLRNPKEIMCHKCFGAFHASYISFSRSLIRTMIREKWCIQKVLFDLDKQGFGKAIYRINTPNAVYHAVFFTQYLDESLRDDRVIAEAWDMTCSLWNGEIRSEDVDDLMQNAPLQEKGRYSSKVISISRANKSVRLFEYLVNCLERGHQPSIEKLKNIGYLARTTAVYGNGKFGMADYLNLLHSDFQQQFRAQMLMVYLVRKFTTDWVQYIAQCRNPQNAATLSHNIARYIGIGNSTGLGMVPFLVKHPHVIHTWIAHREQALYEIIHHASVTDKARESFLSYGKKGIAYFSEHEVPDIIQQQKNTTLASDLKRLVKYMEMQDSISHTLWLDMWNYVNDSHYQYSRELQELFLNILMEIYPNISQSYEDFFYIPEPLPCIGDLSLEEVVHTIEEHFDWALNVDYEEKDETHFFWYRSEEKEEPRLGQRYSESGADKEMRVDVGRRIYHLYYILKDCLHAGEYASVARFLMQYPEWGGEIRRVASYAYHPYGEIRENILSKDIYAIDILRLKLSFFGAVKFDPKSDRWLRITLFQGAPLVDDSGYVEENDNWFLYCYEGTDG